MPKRSKVSGIDTVYRAAHDVGVPTSNRALAARSLVLIPCAALTAGTIGSVHAGIEIGRAGNIGGHGLTDSRESPGATCRFAPPLAWDRASGSWTPFAEGKTRRALATEHRSARFDSRGPETQFFLGYGAYLVTVELSWYERLAAEGEPRLAGQAEYQIEHYATAGRDRAGTHPIGVDTACRLGSR